MSQEAQSGVAKESPLSTILTLGHTHHQVMPCPQDFAYDFNRRSASKYLGGHNVDLLANGRRQVLQLLALLSADQISKMVAVVKRLWRCPL
jgi:hypothetical protein